MSRQPYMCPKCGKAIRRISMSGGSVVHQGLPVPDPDDFSVTLFPCRCTSGKADANFPAFVNVWRQAYNIPDARAASMAPPTPNFATPTAASRPMAT